MVDSEAVQRIRQAADAAAMKVWDDSVIPRYGVMSAMNAVEDMADAAFLTTISDMCADLGIDEQDYYLADPYSAEVAADRLFWSDGGHGDRCEDDDSTMDDCFEHDNAARDEGLGY